MLRPLTKTLQPRPVICASQRIRGFGPGFASRTIRSVSIANLKIVSKKSANRRQAQSISVEQRTSKSPGTLLESLHEIGVAATSRATSATTPGSASTTCPVIGTTNARASVRREARSISARKPRRGRQAGGARAGDRALRVSPAREFLADKASVLGLRLLCLVSTVDDTAIA